MSEKMMTNKVIFRFWVMFMTYSTHNLPLFKTYTIEETSIKVNCIERAGDEIDRFDSSIGGQGPPLAVTG